MTLMSLAALLVSPKVAHAARAATVDVNDTEVLAGPGRNHKVLEKLPLGTQLAASNQPIEGYYKVRTASGALGFVAADALVLAPIPSEDDSTAEAPTPPTAPPTATATPPAAPDSGARKKAARERIRFRALGSYNFFSVGDVNDLFKADVLKFGFGFGGEFGFLFTPNLALVVRVERLGKSIFARDRNTARIFDVSVASYPTMIGLELALTNDKRISTHAAILGGLAMLTTLKTFDTASTDPNATEQSATAFTGVAKIDIAYELNKSWSIFAEAGYRYLKTSQVVPPTSASASDIFKSPTTGEFIPLSINLSGPFLQLGVGFSF